MTVLVAGGTGRMGTVLVTGLAARGARVRVLTREPSRARHLEAVASEIVRGDVRVPATLGPALAGVGTVVSAVHGFAGPGRVSPASVDRDGNANLTAAAADAGAEMVIVSVVGASPDSPMDLFRCKWAAEERLRASGVPWTIVRATAFVELWAEILRRPVVLGRGDNPVNFVSVHDVAAAVERAVLDPSLRGRVLEVAGPEDLTFNRLAAIVQEVGGRPGRVRHVPRWLLRGLAPLHRLPRAALAMDTVDMTAATRPRPAGVPCTTAREALTSAVAAR